jgi:hypothetical protein
VALKINLPESRVQVRSNDDGIMFNVIFSWLPHLCTPHIRLYVRSLSHQPMHRKEGHLLVDGYK